MNQDDMKVLNDMAAAVRKHGALKPLELWKTTDLSIWQFEKFKKYLPQLYEDIIYDRKHKKYISRGNISQFNEENLR